MKRLITLLTAVFMIAMHGMAQIARQHFEIYDEQNPQADHVIVGIPDKWKLSVGVNNEGKVYVKKYIDESEKDLHQYKFEKISSIVETKYKTSEEEQREALMEIYHALGGDNWTNKTNWGSDKPLNEWYGIWTSSYNDEDYKNVECVTHLNLNYNNLVGELPAEAFSKLKNLEYLEIEGNAITGKLPECLNRLKGLMFRFNKSSIDDGPLPEHPWSDLMSYAHGNTWLRFCGILDDWRVPEWAEKHERFPDFWLNFAALPIAKPEQDYFDYWKNKKIPMTEFSLVDLDGNVHSNADFAKNRLTLLLYWESWCPMSEALLKKLIPAYSQLHDKGLEILGLSSLCPNATPCVDEDEYLKYIEDNKILWSNCSVDAEHCIEAFRLYGGSPTVYAVDGNGDIVFQSFTRGYSEIIPFLEEYFGKIEDTEYYTSTDYSQDGKVEIMQQATRGEGIDLVFMGDGFVDKSMADNTYMDKMHEAMEQFFAVEPYSSLRDRFTVKAVKAVSPNAEFAPDAKHAIDKDNDKAFEYAKNAIGDDADKAMVVVVYNANAAVDRSVTNMYEDGSFVAYCMDGVSTILNHEAGGHGLAHLADEYVEPGNEYLTLPDEQKAVLDERHAKEWSMNVDYSKGEGNVWNVFVSDNRYASENIGYYEGAFLYGNGCYRPTENSMMRYNDCGFNAPSREIIYKRVMTLSEPAYQHSHEDFVAFDLAAQAKAKKLKAEGNGLGRVNYTTRAAILNPEKFSPDRYLPAAPVIIEGSWNKK